MSTFSVGGLASGLDTKSIISQLMSIESAPKTQLEWKSQLWSARKTAWSDLNTRLASLQNSANLLLRPETWDTSGAVGVTSSAATIVAASAASGTATPGTHTIDVTKLAQGQLSTSSGSLPGGVVAANDTLTITRGATSWSVAIAAGDDLTAIAAKVNATTGIPVAATVNGSGALELAASTTGAATSFTISSTGPLAGQLAFNVTGIAQDAAFTVDGTGFTNASNTAITTAISGVSLDLKAVGSGTTITVAAPSDAWVNATKAKLQDFVKQYNAVLDQVYQKTQGESRVTNPKTLGDYLQGPMARDVGYSQVGFDLRTQTMDVVSGLPSGASMLADVGIKTSFTIGGGGSNGHLEIDDAKLDAALRSNPSSVQAVLANVGAGTGITAGDGVVRRVSELVSQLRVGGRVDAALQGASAQIKSIQDSIDRATDRLTRKQAFYEHMFASLESTLGKIQSQGSWLQGQLAGLSGGSNG
jgi:flagellar hook-associated protein 2